MADNFHITEGSGITIAAHDNGTALEQQVQVTNLPVTQSVSGTVSVSNFPSSQAVTGTFFQATQPISGTITAVQSDPTQLNLTSNQRPALLGVTGVGVAAAAVTVTLPAVVSQFHYITMVEIQAYTTAARTGAATPVTATSTNLQGSNAWTFSTAAAIGTSESKVFMPGLPLKSAASNTTTTIVCPATVSVIWRINVFYYTAA